jgi:hypothetical protein
VAAKRHGGEMIWFEWIAGVFGVAAVVAVLVGAYLRRLSVLSRTI